MSEPTILLKGERVSLAEMTEEDQPFFQKWHAGNPELRALIDDNSVPTMEDQLRWFARAQENDRTMFSLVTSDDVLIGHGGFVDIEKESAHLRITIGNADFWGKGFGTEATQLIVRFGFQTMKLSSIWLRVLSSNPRAIRAYEKVGFVRWGDAETEEERQKNVMRMHILLANFQ